MASSIAPSARCWPEALHKSFANRIATLARLTPTLTECDLQLDVHLPKLASSSTTETHSSPRPPPASGLVSLDFKPARFRRM